MKTASIQLVLAPLLLLASGRVLGQAPQPATVAAQGTVELQRQPEVLRVQVEVLAKGKDLAEALTKLRERRQAAQKQLTAMGVANTNVEFGEPRLSSEKTQQQ